MLVYYYVMVGSSASILLYNGGFQCLYITNGDAERRVQRYGCRDGDAERRVQRWGCGGGGGGGVQRWGGERGVQTVGAERGVQFLMIWMLSDVYAMKMCI